MSGIQGFNLELMNNLSNLIIKNTHILFDVCDVDLFLEMKALAGILQLESMLSGKDR